MLNLLCDTKSAFIEHRQLCAAKAENKQLKHKNIQHIQTAFNY